MSILACVAVAAIVLIIGGLLAGWDIWGMLTSSTALLIYVILLIVIVIALFKWFYDKDTR